MRELMIPPAGHVYDSLDSDVAEELRQCAIDIRRRHASVTCEMLEVGKSLTATKDKVPHGTFLAWVEHEVGLSHRMAQLYMRAAEWASDGRNAKLISHLQPTSVLKLAAKSTPESVVEAVAGKVQAGTVVKVSDVDVLLSEAREQKRKDAEEARLSERTKKRRSAEKAEREARAEQIRIEIEEERRAAAEERREIAAILVQHLPQEALAKVRKTLRTDTLSSVWTISYASGVPFSPMDVAIEEAVAASAETVMVADFTPPTFAPIEKRDWEDAA
ncbi:DUF3102 domain-containing protein [Mesorhizobium sp. 8]|uniref:DUF3102 domain-containing protein n=1 Tax=Mesorhizobium sp. 8 TaxID=2584466 RepID=UPI001122061B|nr:DUF3102 domain-containing protein [Mesorhizobium sp. 8]QDC00321.1 DUF3102 domain-containing protein [Mesorhizobium sp. 8]